MGGCGCGSRVSWSGAVVRTACVATAVPGADHCGPRPRVRPWPWTTLTVVRPWPSPPRPWPSPPRPWSLSPRPWIRPPFKVLRGMSWAVSRSGGGCAGGRNRGCGCVHRGALSGWLFGLRRPAASGVSCPCVGGQGRILRTDCSVPAARPRPGGRAGRDCVSMTGAHRAGATRAACAQTGCERLTWDAQSVRSSHTGWVHLCIGVRAPPLLMCASPHGRCVPAAQGTGHRERTGSHSWGPRESHLCDTRAGRRRNGGRFEQHPRGHRLVPPLLRTLVERCGYLRRERVHRSRRDRLRPRPEYAATVTT